MHISRLELSNIKSHASSTFDFTRGTTAITGENGSGKTTIIEAIAWVLFDLLEYKKEDFIKRGEKKGWARVTFESGLDEREYQVYRDSGAAYFVTDPRLQTRIADKKEEVFRFLWQHLGLEPGTDLKSLFRQAIGVPQGTFTAIFLEGAAERKAAFDRLLKVEEYRQAAEKLRETARFIDASVTGAREAIARAEGELARAETVEAEHTSYIEQIETLSAALVTLADALAQLTTSVKDFEVKERHASEMYLAFEKLRNEKEKSSLLLTQFEQAVARAEEAAKIVTNVQADSVSHAEALARLKELERERVERDRLRNELSKTETAVINVRADQKRLLADRDDIAKKRAEITSLASKRDEQDVLEKDLSSLREQVASARATQSQIASLEEKLGRLRENFRQNQTQRIEAEGKSQSAENIAELETRGLEVMQTLATLRAHVERDEKFQIEIKGGFCPILSQRCLNLKEGETLETFLASQFTDLRSQISVFEVEHQTITVNLKQARDAERYLSALDSYRNRERDLTEEGTRLKDEKANLERQVESLPGFEQRLSELETNLKSLGDPRSRIRFLENETARENDLRSAATNIESNLERLESDRRITFEQLESYKDLDEHWSRSSAERDRTAEAHRLYITNEKEAASLVEKREQLQQHQAAFSDIAANAEKAEAEFRAAAAAYDRAAHDAQRAALIDTERSQAETRATLDAAKRRETELAAELKNFAELRKSMQNELRDKERLERVAETTDFIRGTLKEAAPRVARNYVFHVSVEANQMFREITGNAEHTLRWVEDYSVMLEEDGYERPFHSLSGGEQMAAALSIRLALLKQLTDIRIAFFDEPTTNMDAARRENLAMQMNRITHFDQLFVISHDETFDSYVDNVVSVG